jgi:pyruvate/2-oxoglutarate dehydrogenase complex dihydrolipoamide acyltransferase (E2) component
MRSICVFCGSSPGFRPVYAEAAAQTGRTLAEAGLSMVFGGSKVGLMGAAADGALAAGGEVFGVLPRAPEEFCEHGGVHIGIAVALEDGLTVPVVKNANLKPIRQLSAEVKDLAFKAKNNKLGMDELTGSTFSISNMGMLDVDTFLAIVNQPNAAIVAIASVRKKVVVGDDDEVEIRHRMNITGSFDHRVADGAVGAKFINLIKGYLENPTRLLR